MTETNTTTPVSLVGVLDGIKADLREELAAHIATTPERLFYRIPFSKLRGLESITGSALMVVLRELDGYVGGANGDTLPWPYQLQPSCITNEVHVLLLTDRVRNAPELSLAEELACMIAITADAVNVPLDEVFGFSGPIVIVSAYEEMNKAQRERFRDHLRYSLLPYGYSLNRATVGSTLEVRRDR